VDAAGPIDAVVFDLDGVLLDSESVWDEARRELARASGVSWPADATTAMLGMSSVEWSAYMRERVGVPLEPEAIDERVVERVLGLYRSELPLLPGAVESVRRLAARWPLALASSSNRPVIDLALRRAGIASLFAVTVSSEEVERGKPAPDVYDAACAALGVRAAAAAGIEDSANGLRAAHAAGLLVVAIPNERFPPAAEALALADLTLAGLPELTPAAIEAAARARH
jgi:HAD superfamily hydrolase (TIGR01509 family)